MTDQEMRIAIAERLGWRIADESGMSSLVHWVDGDGAAMLSDPLADLNAMHAAEKTLGSCSNWDAYLQYLHELNYNEVAATARQRAEAFLRAIGKDEN